MENPDRPSADSFAAQLRNEEVLTLQIIYASLAGGIVLFTAVVLFLSLTAAQGGPATDPALVRILTGVELAITVPLIYVSSLVFRTRLESAARDDRVPNASLPAVLRSALILRVAILEGGAMFGLVVCLIAVTSGVMQTNPAYWINLIGVLAMLTVVSQGFPTRDRLVEIYQSRILG